VGPEDADFRRGHSQEHQFGSHGLDALSDIEAKDVQYNVQQNLRCCWTCEYVEGKRITSLTCTNKKNFTSAFRTVDVVGMCVGYKHNGVYR
jgi:hypothetical protein